MVSAVSRAHHHRWESTHPGAPSGARRASCRRCRACRAIGAPASSAEACCTRAIASTCAQAQELQHAELQQPQQVRLQPQLGQLPVGEAADGHYLGAACQILSS